jgi:hypothetical protein
MAQMFKYGPISLNQTELNSRASSQQTLWLILTEPNKWIKIVDFS